MKGSSAQVQLPGNSQTLAQRTAMWSLALTQGAMMILSADIRACLNLSHLKGLPAKCRVGTEEARETVISEGEIQRKPHFFSRLRSRTSLPAGEGSLCSAHLTLIHWPEASGLVRMWTVLCASTFSLVLRAATPVPLFQLDVAQKKAAKAETEHCFSWL